MRLLGVGFAGARAEALYSVAASLLERVWRADGEERDREEAIFLYGRASSGSRSPDACVAAIRAAELAG